MNRSRRTRGRGFAWLDARRIDRVRPAAMLLLVAFAPSLHAQNIVPNPELDTQLAPWAPYVSSTPDPVGSGALPAWAASPDINGGASSGSALIGIDASAPAANAISGIAQCIEFNDATLVSFVNYGMSFRVPTTMAADSSMSATVEIRLFANAGCSDFISGGAQGQTITPAMASDTTWYRLSDNSFTLPGAPVMAASAQIRGYLRQTGASPTQSDYPINLDHFVLVLNSTTPVELMHFDVE